LNPTNININDNKIIETSFVPLNFFTKMKNNAVGTKIITNIKIKINDIIRFCGCVCEITANGKSIGEVRA